MLKNTFNTLFILILLCGISANAQYSKEQRQLLLKAKKEKRYQEVKDSIDGKPITQSYKDYGFLYSKDDIVLQKVIELEGTKSELYLKAKKGIIERTKNPDFSIVADVENEVIKYRAKQRYFHSKGGLIRTDYGLSYTVTIEFKDNRVRVGYEVLIIKYVDGEFIGETPLPLFNNFVWRSNGKYRNNMESFPKNMTTFLNSHCNTIFNSMNNKDDW